MEGFRPKKLMALWPRGLPSGELPPAKLALWPRLWPCVLPWPTVASRIRGRPPKKLLALWPWLWPRGLPWPPLASRVESFHIKICRPCGPGCGRSRSKSVRGAQHHSIVLAPSDYSTSLSLQCCSHRFRLLLELLPMCVPQY